MAAAAKRRLTRRKRSSLSHSRSRPPPRSFLLSCFMRAKAPPRHRARLPQAGEIVIGVDASFPPFALDDGQSIQGLDIDLARAIAAELLTARSASGTSASTPCMTRSSAGKSISWFPPARRSRPHGRPALYPVVFRQWSCIRCGARRMTKAFDITVARQSRASPTNTPAAPKQRSAPGKRTDRSLQRLPYELPEYALDALRLGLADGAIVDATTLRLYLRARRDWQPRYEYITHELYAIAIRIDRADAWKLVDGALGCIDRKRRTR